MRVCHAFYYHHAVMNESNSLLTSSQAFAYIAKEAIFKSEAADAPFKMAPFTKLAVDKIFALTEE